MLLLSLLSAIALLSLTYIVFAIILINNKVYILFKSFFTLLILSLKLISIAIFSIVFAFSFNFITFTNRSSFSLLASKAINLYTFIYTIL